MSYTKFNDDKDFGHFNELPEGFKLVDEEEFYDRFFQYCVAGLIFRQPRRNIDTNLLYPGELFGNIDMFPLTYDNCHDIGYGIAQVYNNKFPSQSKRIVFFRFGSDEKWTALNNRMCALNSRDNS